MKTSNKKVKKTGYVSLVGAGPGDPDLLTVKALRLLQTADVVVYDRLVSREVLDLIPPGVSRFFVGKRPGNHCVPQDQINDTIVNMAKSGRRVVRLKGGDPYMFGRGGEEVLALGRCGIPFEVVPGITAASGCGTYAGIPLTHRGISRRVQFITGHCIDNQPLSIDWKKVADPESTLVIYMGLSNIDFLSRSLMQAGLAPSTPAAAIKNGTTAEQECLRSTLSRLPAEVRDQGFRAPVLVIIGGVVSLADDLDWFQSALGDFACEPDQVSC